MIEPAGAPALGAPAIESTFRASRFCAPLDSPEEGSASRAMLRKDAGAPLGAPTLFEIAAAAAATEAADEGGMPPLELTAVLLLVEMLLLLFSPSDKPAEEGAW